MSIASSVGSVYSSNAAVDAEKYAFFSLAALELPRALNWNVDILHAHDWHTALAVYARGAVLKNKPSSSRCATKSAVDGVIVRITKPTIATWDVEK